MGWDEFCEGDSRSALGTALKNLGSPRASQNSAFELLKFNYQSGLRRSQRCNQNQELTKLAREHTPEGRTGNEKRETRNGNEN